MSQWEAGLSKNQEMEQPDGARALFHIRTTGVKNIGFGSNLSDDWDLLKEWNDAAIIKL